MSRWFRWYEGTTEDAKFRVVARVSRVTVRDVIALWAFILEDSSHLDHRGVCSRNKDFMAATLDFEDGVVESILDAMQDVGLISLEHTSVSVCNWGKRQFESDTDPTAAERQRRKRERDRAAGNEDVTRDSRGPETDTEKKDIREATASLVNGVAVDLTRKRIERSQSDQALLDRITDRWNAWAKPRGLPAVALLTAQRSIHCRRRVADLQALTGDETPEAAFDKLLAKCDASFFIRGSPRSKLGFDQLMREGFMARMMENGFENQERKQSWQR